MQIFNPISSPWISPLSHAFSSRSWYCEAWNWDSWMTWFAAFIKSTWRDCTNGCLRMCSGAEWGINPAVFWGALKPRPPDDIIVAVQASSTGYIHKGIQNTITWPDCYVRLSWLRSWLLTWTWHSICLAIAQNVTPRRTWLSELLLCIEGLTGSYYTVDSNTHPALKGTFVNALAVTMIT